MESVDIHIDDSARGYSFACGDIKELLGFGERFVPSKEIALEGSLKLGSFLDKWGVYRDWANPLYDFDFESIEVNNQMVFLKYHSKWGIIDFNGKVISRAAYDRILHLSNGMFIGRRYSDRYFSRDDDLFSSDGQLLFQGQQIEDDFDENRYLVINHLENGKKTHSLLLDYSGSEIPLPAEDVRAIRRLSNGGYVLTTSEEDQIICDSHIVAKIEHIIVDGDYDNGRLKIRNKCYGRAYLDEHYQLIPYEVISYDYGVKTCLTLGVYRVIKEGEVLGEFRRIKHLPGFGFAVGENGGFEVLYDEQFVKVSGNDSIFPVGDLEVWSKDKSLLLCHSLQIGYGICDKTGKKILPCAYKRGILYSRDLICAEGLDPKNSRIVSVKTGKDQTVDFSRIKRIGRHIVQINNQQFVNSDCDVIDGPLWIINKNHYLQGRGIKFSILDEYGKEIMGGCLDAVSSSDGKVLVRNKPNGPWIDVETKDVIESIDKLSITKPISTEGNYVLHGVVTGIKKYGLFIKVPGENAGLLHISFFARCDKPFNYRIGEAVRVIIEDTREDGKIFYRFAPLAGLPERTHGDIESSFECSLF